MAIANVVTAYGAGIRIFDASVGGLGGCPFAPGATGNVASEDVVHLFERMGIATGINLARLLPIADRAAAIPGAVAGGRLRAAPRERLLQEETRTSPSEG
jgi:hydroxymethylglutaryl-CoA lyase